MKILCLGDSLTYGYAIPRGQVWTALCAAQTGIEIINRGVNGNTTGGMQAQLAAELAYTRPDAVILLGGCNDLIYGCDLAGARANMGGMAHFATAAGVLPLIGTPISPRPAVRRDWEGLIPENLSLVLSEYTDWLRLFSRSLHFPLLDFGQEFPKLAARYGIQQEACYLADGLHPNQMGHALMAEIAAKRISALSQERKRQLL